MYAKSRQRFCLVGDDDSGRPAGALLLGLAVILAIALRMSPFMNSPYAVSYDMVVVVTPVSDGVAGLVVGDVLSVLSQRNVAPA